MAESRSAACIRLTLHGATLREDLVFTDDTVNLPAPVGVTEVHFELQSIPIVRAEGGAEHRFLAMSPPSPLDLTVRKKSAPGVLARDKRNRRTKRGGRYRMKKVRP